MLPWRTLLTFTSRMSQRGKNFTMYVQRANQRHCLPMLIQATVTPRNNVVISTLIGLSPGKHILPPSQPLYRFLSWHISTFMSVICSWHLPLFLAVVVDNLQTGGFFNDTVTKSCLFSTVHDAVLYCQTSGILSHNEVMKELMHAQMATRHKTLMFKERLDVCLHS